MLTAMIKKLYYKYVPELRRKQLYKITHPAIYKDARTLIYPSAKGNFSLRGYTQKKAIFIHIPKAAGTSVALSIFNELPYHYKAIDYIVIFGRKDFDRYFKFAFVRNPWDRIYSAYNFLIKGGWNENDEKWAKENIAQYADFTEFVENWVTSKNIYSYIHFIPQYEFIFDHHGNILVDYLGYFETIDEDFKKISAELCSSTNLAHTNKSTRLDYTHQYTDKTKKIVESVYQKDIELFGYKFGGINNKTIIGKR